MTAMLVIFLLAIPVAAFAGAKVALRHRAHAPEPVQPDAPLPDNVVPFRKRA